LEVEAMKYFQWMIIVLLFGVFLTGSGCSSDKGARSIIAPPTEDTAPPLAPAGLAAPKIDGGGFLLTWEPGTDADVAGYRVYLYHPSPARPAAYVLKNPLALVPTTRFVVHLDQVTDNLFWVRVTAVDTAGNESPPSDPLCVILPTGTGRNEDHPPGTGDGAPAQP
jgi:hypothetical protein